MKEYFRRGASLFIAFVLLFSFTAQPASAITDLVYLCINDSFVKSMTSVNMPIKINNNMYISYRYLARIRSIKFFYDEDINILRMYNSSATLIFDVGNAITYDQDGKIYSYLAEKRGGVLFVPIEFVCRIFGIYYSQTNTPTGQVIRINGIMSSYSDSEIISANRQVMRDIYNSYYASEVEDEGDDITEQPGQNGGDTTPPPEEPEDGDIGTPVRKTVYLAFLGQLNSYTSDILNAMSRYGYSGTFFVENQDLKESSDLLRQIVCQGHSLGLYVSSANPVEEAEELNLLLSSFVMRRSRLVCIKEGSTALTAEQRTALTEAGYRIWDASLDPGSQSRTAYTVGVNSISLLDRAARISALRLYSNESTAGAMGTILSHLRQNQWYVSEINDWTTPINAIRYYS